LPVYVIIFHFTYPSTFLLIVIHAYFAYIVLLH
jgi:hypothetical protein